MKVLVGECTGEYWVPKLQALGWGRMWIARGRNIYTYPGEPWGLDNGAFRDWKDGVPFDGDQFARVIEKAEKHPPPYLAVLPDIPGGGLASYELSMSWLDRVPAFPWHLAVQDGMEPADVDPSLFSGLFLGGTNAYKATAAMWCDFAHASGLRFHYGRCGTQAKIAHAIDIGADSIDSAVAMWTKPRWRVFRDSLTIGPSQSDMFYRE